MLGRDYLRERADDYRIALQNRGSKVDLDRFIQVDAERRRIIVQVESLKNQRNVASQEIATLKKNKQDASSQIDAMKRVGDEIKTLDEKLAALEQELSGLELGFPNVPHSSVPVGALPGDIGNRWLKVHNYSPLYCLLSALHRSCRLRVQRQIPRAAISLNQVAVA